LKQRGDARSLWDLWVEIQLGDLKLTLADVLAELPLTIIGTDGPQVDGRSEEDSTVADFRWLLERLRDGAGLRLNCGGEVITAPDGRVWGRDRFFLSGEMLWGEDTGVAVSTTTGPEPLYQRLRGFLAREDESLWGYRIPLPTGSYRVRLHLAETQFNTKGFRRYDVWAQERQVLHDVDALEEAGFRTALVKEFSVELAGGPLEIRFVYRSGQRPPSVAGIEIEIRD